MRYFFLSLLFLLSCGFASPLMSQELSSPAFTKTVDGLLERSVPLMTVKELAERQEEVVILDSRPAKENEVAQIKGARRVGYRDFDPSKVADLPKDKPVVVYCSVGYRSEKIGEKLQALGFTQVYNLYGGIFEWFNEGQPVFDPQGQEVDKVHPYDRNWGQWLEPREKE